MSAKIVNNSNELLETIVEGADIHNTSTVVVFVHGFGTSLHERGVFDDAVGVLTGNDKHLTTVRFSWSGFGKSEGKQEDTTFQKVAGDLRAVLDWVYANKPKFANVVVIGFSMGNIVVSNVMASGEYKVNRIININPADFKPGVSSFQKWLTYRGVKIEKDILVIPRTDGTITRIRRAFWDTMDEMHYRENLEKSVQLFPSILVRAVNDHIVDNSELKAIDFSKIIELSGDHNYSDPQDRKGFLCALSDLFVERNTIVDENDNVIGAKTRFEITRDDIYRVSSLWLRNGKGQVLLAKRALTKSHDPGKWGPSVAGTVAEDEDYITNIRKETEEELGLSDLGFEVGPKRLVEGVAGKFFSQKYFAVTDKDVSDMKIQKDEVDEIKWFDEDKLLDLVHQKPDMFTYSMRDSCKSLMP